MQSAPNAWDKIKVADVVVSTNHVAFLTNRFPRLISLPTSAIFVSRTSGIAAISKYRSVNPIYIYILLLFIPNKPFDGECQSWGLGECGLPLHCRAPL